MSTASRLTAGRVVDVVLEGEECLGLVGEAGVELEQPEGGGQADHPEETAEQSEQRHERQPLGGAAGVGMDGTTEHGDQLRLQARGEARRRPPSRVGDVFQVVDQPGQRQPVAALGRQR